MERRGSNHFIARHRTNLKTNANTINYSAKAGRRASLGCRRPSFPLAKGPPGNPILRTCPPRQGYGWENYTVSHERLVNHNTAAKFAKRPTPLRIMNRRIANSPRERPRSSQIGFVQASGQRAHQGLIARLDGGGHVRQKIWLYRAVFIVNWNGVACDALQFL